jgi:hypothetical protein
MGTEIKDQVHELYWKYDINCARTMLTCLGELFDTSIEAQTLNSAIGLHGAGGFRAQCGLVEGALMFIGIYYSNAGRNEEDIALICYQYEDDPPHVCEAITCEAVEFAGEFIKTVNEADIRRKNVRPV